MRKLNKKQKKLLDKWFETVKNEPGLAVRDVVKDLLPYDLWVELTNYTRVFFSMHIITYI